MFTVMVILITHVLYFELEFNWSAYESDETNGLNSEVQLIS